MFDEQRLLSILPAFRPRDRDFLRGQLSSSDDSRRVADVILTYLGKRSKSDWVDFEAVEILGYELGLLATHDFRDQLEKALGNLNECPLIFSAFFTEFRKGYEEKNGISKFYALFRPSRKVVLVT